ncbi:uncharacterized protein L203_105242 [Cryptococcus depauperatus CBS 7841]|uniref:Uncharacterized protein n=1 Tax=Cryptococcus depauperatus CBS 7841 TaxID=1295531 RepID=A0A1E3HYE8_9TREE|nr:hypothetical protein L203_05609 [Cryptococcus depauperatus CBS 7841]
MVCECIKHSLPHCDITLLARLPPEIVDMILQIPTEDVCKAHLVNLLGVSKERYLILVSKPYPSVSLNGKNYHKFFAPTSKRVIVKDQILFTNTRCVVFGKDYMSVFCQNPEILLGKLDVENTYAWFLCGEVCVYMPSPTATSPLPSRALEITKLFDDAIYKSLGLTVHNSHLLMPKHHFEVSDLYFKLTPERAAVNGDIKHEQEILKWRDWGFTHADTDTM